MLLQGVERYDDYRVALGRNRGKFSPISASFDGHTRGSTMAIEHGLPVPFTQ